jgi:hypothetical protein
MLLKVLQFQSIQVLTQNALIGNEVIVSAEATRAESSSLLQLVGTLNLSIRAITAGEETLRLFPRIRPLNRRR